MTLQQPTAHLPVTHGLIRYSDTQCSIKTAGWCHRTAWFVWIKAQKPKNTRQSKMWEMPESAEVIPKTVTKCFSHNSLSWSSSRNICHWVCLLLCLFRIPCLCDVFPSRSGLQPDGGATCLALPQWLSSRVFRAVRADHTHQPQQRRSGAAAKTPPRFPSTCHKTWVTGTKRTSH